MFTEMKFSKGPTNTPIYLHISQSLAWTYCSCTIPIHCQFALYMGQNDGPMIKYLSFHCQEYTNIALDKVLFSIKNYRYFSYFSTKTFIVGTL